MEIIRRRIWQIFLRRKWQKTERRFQGETRFNPQFHDFMDFYGIAVRLCHPYRPQSKDIMETYKDTWGRFVSLMEVKKYPNNGSEAFSVDPEFEQMRIGNIETLQEPSEEVSYSENYHLENVENHVKEIYYEIRNELQKLDQNLIINPTNYYISLGTKVGTKSEYICVVQFRKKKIRIVVFSSEQEVKGEVKHHVVVHLGETTQRFWNHESCEIIVDKKENLGEVISVLSSLLRRAMKTTSG